MPRATRLMDTDKFELKTCPGAWIELQRMSYLQSVERQALMKMSLSSSGNKKNKNDFQGEMRLASKEMQLFEFQCTIVDHNLEDENGVLLNLKSEEGLTRLDSRIGQEVAKLVSDMNNFDFEEEENGNL